MRATASKKAETVEARLLRAAEQAVEWSRGERELRTTIVEGAPASSDDAGAPRAREEDGGRSNGSVSPGEG